MKFSFIHAEKALFPVAALCRHLSVSRSGYYAWAKRPESERKKRDRALQLEVAAIHQESRGTYGAPRVHAELKARGQRVARKRVARLMRQTGLRGRARRRFVRTTDSAHRHPVAPNTLERNFHPGQPHCAWVGDLTYVWTDEGWLYLAVLLELFSRKVVGWAMGERIDSGLVLSALDMALLGGPAPRLHYSDRLNPPSTRARTTADDWRRGIGCSMSRKGNCWDNAVAESFFSTLKLELVYGTPFKTREAAKQSLFEYIEVVYNRKRRHSALGYVSPAECERMAAIKRLAA
ncbi:IS3 family transposase [Corallococcus silvisoli]|uniref:IS3 family transposase n=1 Tax=Corallococcus silvisoli TaxID=2697031 RepID=UPI001378A793|nr:IS3 family transposase [Corallococcus silvisoli]